MTVHEWHHDQQTARDISDYLLHLKAAGKSPRTVELRRWHLYTLAERHAKPIAKLTLADLTEHLTSNPKYTPATRYAIRATLRDFYAFLQHNGRVKISPAAALPKIRIGRRNLPPAPEDAVLTGINAADERTALMIEIAARQGLRRAEIAKIHVGNDVYMDGDGWALRVHGKGDKDRTVPLHTDLAVRILKAGPDWLFPNRDGGHLTESYVGVLMSRALPEGVTAHSLRRRFATRTFDASHDMRAVQELLGHSSLAITERYIGTRPDTLRAALETGDTGGRTTPRGGHLSLVPPASQVG